MVKGSTPLAGLLNRSSRLLSEYQYELALKKEAEWFDRYALDCPNCGNMAIIPAGDYICKNCRRSGTSPTL